MVYFANLCVDLRDRLRDVEVPILTGLTRLRSASYGAARWINWIQKGEMADLALPFTELSC